MFSLLLSCHTQLGTAICACPTSNWAYFLIDIMYMLSKIKDIVNKRKKDIVLGIIIFLLILLSFSIGYITAKYQPSQPIQFIDNQSR